KTATPADVFFDLQQRPLFKSMGFTARLRRQAESIAREKIYLHTGSSEVSLNDIYQAHHSHILTEQSAGLSDEELSVENSICYAFPPVVELIRQADRLGLKIIIVSDTYLNKQQLSDLLREKLPQDVMCKISHIFC